MSSTFRGLLLRAVAVSVLGVGLSACGHGKATEERQFVDQPVEQLYNQGADYLDKRRYEEASQAFDEVERQHPYSVWARRAILMNAYAKYEANKYSDAIDAARRFIALHPGNASAPYAYYLVATCYFEQILDVGRDQKNTESALQALNEVIQRYPQSEYARDARLKADMTYDQLAGKEMEVGRFYETHDEHIAAIARFKNVIDNPNYQRTTHTPEALHRLVECYLSVGMIDEARKAAAVLGYNFPGNPWYQRTYKLMTEKGVSMADQAEAQKRGWLGRTFGGAFAKPSPEAKKPAPPPPADQPDPPGGA
jgi:outer membrane protein assembly factor BamD